MTQNRKLRLQWSEDRGRSFLRVQGWTETELGELGRLAPGDLARRVVLLPSEVSPPAAGDYRALPPVAGSFSLEGDSVCFFPRFPFRDGMQYSLVVDSHAGEGDPEVWTIQRPSAVVTPTTEVAAIYPTAAEVPVNLLKVYVHFSAPMSEGWAGRAIKVCREDSGEVLEGVFLPPEPELWDPDRRRLTMLLDPGRIKRGLAPNLEAGYPLMEGVPIKVMVDAEFRDAGGQPLVAGTERSYRIGPPLWERIDPGCWKLIPPAAGSWQPLSVEFDRPLDHALLQHCLVVKTTAGASLSGEVTVGPEERSWRFCPDTPWEAGRYHLAIGPNLEDLAGNSPLRVFDRDITVEEVSHPAEVNLALPFTCAG